MMKNSTKKILQKTATIFLVLICIWVGYFVYKNIDKSNSKKYIIVGVTLINFFYYFFKLFIYKERSDNSEILASLFFLIGLTFPFIEAINSQVINKNYLFFYTIPQLLNLSIIVNAIRIEKLNSFNSFLSYIVETIFYVPFFIAALEVAASINIITSNKSFIIFNTFIYLKIIYFLLLGLILFFFKRNYKKTNFTTRKYFFLILLLFVIYILSFTYNFFELKVFENVKFIAISDLIRLLGINSLIFVIFTIIENRKIIQGDFKPFIKYYTIICLLMTFIPLILDQTKLYLEIFLNTQTFIGTIFASVIGTIISTIIISKIEKKLSS